MFLNKKTLLKYQIRFEFPWISLDSLTWVFLSFKEIRTEDREDNITINLEEKTHPSNFASEILEIISSLASFCGIYNFLSVLFSSGMLSFAQSSTLLF